MSKSKKIEYLDYEKTIELEKSIEVKNKANRVYEAFISSISLNLSGYIGSKSFKLGSDSNGDYFLTLEDDCLLFEIHQDDAHYALRVSPRDLFDAIIENKKSYELFYSFVYKKAKEKSRKKNFKL